MKLFSFFKNLFFPFKILKIDIYLLKNYLKFVILSFFLFTSIFIFADIIIEIQRFIREMEKGNENVNFTNILTLYYHLIPEFILWSAPVSFLFATVYILDQFYRNNEVIVCINSGMHLFRFLLPIWILSFIFSILLIPFSNFVVTPATKFSKEFRYFMFKATPLSYEYNIEIFGQDNWYYWIEEYSKKNGIMYYPTLFKIRDINTNQSYDQEAFIFDKTKDYPELTEEKLDSLYKATISDLNIKKQDISEFKEDTSSKEGKDKKLEDISSKEGKDKKLEDISSKEGKDKKLEDTSSKEGKDKKLEDTSSKEGKDKKLEDTSSKNNLHKIFNEEIEIKNLISSKETILNEMPEIEIKNEIYNNFKEEKDKIIKNNLNQEDIKYIDQFDDLAKLKLNNKNSDRAIDLNVPTLDQVIDNIASKIPIEEKKEISPPPIEKKDPPINEEKNSNSLSSNKIIKNKNIPIKPNTIEEKKEISPPIEKKDPPINEEKNIIQKNDQDISLLKKLPKNIYDQKELIFDKNTEISTDLSAKSKVENTTSKEIPIEKIPYEKPLEGITMNVISRDTEILSILSKNISDETILSKSKISKKNFNIPIPEYFKLPITSYFLYRIDAKKAIWNEEHKYWNFIDVEKRIWDQKSKTIILEKYDTYILKTEETHQFFEKFFNYSRKLPKELNISEGKEMINYLKLGKRKWEDLYIDLYSEKIAFPISSLFLAIMGSLLSKFHSRKLLFLSSLFKSTLVFAIYFVTFKFGISFAKITGIFPIFISPFLGSILFLILCILFSLRVKT